MRSLLALCVASVLAAAPAAYAQEPARPDCDAILTEALTNPSEANLNAARLCQEVIKLREEVADLERNNRVVSSSPLGFLLPWSTLIVGVITAMGGLIVGVFVPFVGLLINRTFRKREERKLEQEKLLNLLEGVGSGERTRQLAATSALLRRYEELAREHRNQATVEMKTIQDVFLAILRDPGGGKTQAGEGAFAKYLGDAVVRAFGIQDESARTNAEREPAVRRTPPRPPGFSFAEHHLEGAVLRHVFWAGVAAEGVDFFQADLSSASLRDSWLKGAIFYEANLERAVLRRSDLTGANLSMARLGGADLRQATLSGATFTSADLSGARLHGADLTGASGLDTARFDAATAWDDATRWPDDRRPGAGYALAA